MVTWTNGAQYTIAVICTGFFIWQATDVTILFYNQPVTTVFRKIHGNISALNKLTVCCTADECLGAGKKSPGLEYARGYWERQDLPVDSNKPEPSRQEMLTEMARMQVGDPMEFIRLKSNISVFHEDLGRRGAFPDPKFIQPPQSLIGSMSSKDDLICVKAPNVINSLSNANTTHASRFFDSGQMVRGEITEIVFMVKTPAIEKFYVTLHSGSHWYYFPKPYLLRVVADDYINSSISSYLRADIQRILKVSRRNFACISPEPGAMYPARFAQYVCEQDCDEYVVQTVFGCSYTNILKGIPESDIPYCNKWDLPNDPLTISNLTNVWKQCVTKNHCSEQHYCEEWDVKIQKTEMLGPFKVVDKNMTVHRFKIFVAPQLTKIEEELIVSPAQWVASVGGLMGMYIGLSLLSIFAIVWKFFQGCSKRVWPDQDVDEKDREGKTSQGWTR